MHIALNGWFWDRPNTGSGQYLRNLLHHLCIVAPDVQFTLVLPPHNKTPDALPERVNWMTTDGPGGKFGKVWFEQRVFPRMALRCGADIAHVPYWGTPLSSPVRLVTSILDVIPLMLPVYARGIATRLYTGLVSAASSGSAHTITLSEAAKADIVTHLHLPPESITPTHLAADPRFHPKIGAERDDSVREKYRLPERFVLHIGGFDVRKQVNMLLDAYTYLAQSGEGVPLVLAGAEPQWGAPVFPDMRQYAAQLGLSEHIHWPGCIDEADKPSVIRLADVVVSASALEGFGLPVLEAMACGTPVVANSTAVTREVAGDGAFLTENAREMAGALVSVLNERPLRESLVTHGLARASQFSWRRTAQQTLAVYARVMGNAGVI